jgi:hypothetical protein
MESLGVHQTPEGVQGPITPVGPPPELVAQLDFDPDALSPSPSSHLAVFESEDRGSGVQSARSPIFVGSSLVRQTSNAISDVGSTFEEEESRGDRSPGSELTTGMNAAYMSAGIFFTICLWLFITQNAWHFS